MNENLKQIAIQAKVEHCISHVRLQEFAELIVQECLKEVFYTIEDEEQDNISGSIRDRIKEHFGVEE